MKYYSYKEKEVKCQDSLRMKLMMCKSPSLSPSLALYLCVFISLSILFETLDIFKRSFKLRIKQRYYI